MRLGVSHLGSNTKSAVSNPGRSGHGVNDSGRATGHTRHSTVNRPCEPGSGETRGGSCPGDRTLRALTRLGSQTGSQHRQTPGHVRRLRAMISAARSPMRPHPAVCSDAADAPEKLTVGCSDSCCTGADYHSARCQRSLATPGCAGTKWEPGDCQPRCQSAGRCDSHRPLLFKIRSITSAPVVITGRSSCR